MIFFSDECELCYTPTSKSSMLSILYRFLTKQLVPELYSLTKKYAVWWRFKENSTLKVFLNDEDMTLNEFFTPNELITAIQEVATKHALYDGGNRSIIVLHTSPLQAILNKDIIFVPCIAEYCLPHIDFVSFQESLELQNKYILKQLPTIGLENIPYADDTSFFYVHPILSSLINEKYNTWKVLLNSFKDFCTQNREHFDHTDSTIITINEHSPLATLLAIKHFHVSQCETILKYLTFFLGRTSSLQTICPNLNFKGLENSAIFIFLHNLIDTQTYHLLPQFYKMFVHL